MKPIEALREEHLAIGAMLDVFESALGRLEQGQPVALDMLRGLLQFAEWFTGASHDQKEERGLFPLVASQEVVAARAIGAFCRQHRDCDRSLIGALEAFDRLRRGAADMQPTFVAAARRYIAGRRRNLKSEEAWLRSGAAAAAADGAAASLEAGFGTIERAEIGPTGREWFRQVIDDYRDIAASWRGRPSGRTAHAQPRSPRGASPADA
jgi:hemerythrin-like domain-containing protein